MARQMVAPEAESVRALKQHHGTLSAAGVPQFEAARHCASEAATRQT